MLSLVAPINVMSNLVCSSSCIDTIIITNVTSYKFSNIFRKVPISIRLFLA